MPASKEAGNQRVAFLTVLGLALLMILLTSSGYSRQMVTGEGLYDLSYPARYPFLESITTFFSGRVAARFMHGVLVTLLYKVFGFNPPVFYLMLQLGVILSALCVTLCLSERFKARWHTAVIAIVLSSLPFLVPQLLFFKKAHHVFAWAFFWIAVLLFRLWSRSHAIIWLAGVALFFTMAFLSYEAIAFLLPVAVFISHSNFREGIDFIYANLAAVAITILAYLSSQVLAIAAGVHSRQIQGGFLEVIAAPLQAPLAVLRSLLADGMSAPFVYAQWALQAGKLLTAGLLLAGAWLLVRELRAEATWARLQKASAFWLALAGFWLIFYTYLPFLLAGQGSNEDNLVGLGYGLVFLLVAVVSSIERPFASSLVVGLTSLFLVFSGLIVYQHSSENELEIDARFINFVTSLKDEIPNVKEGTTFVLISANWGRTACIGYMNMLYSRNDLHCIHLLDNDTDESYTRVLGQLVEDTGRVFDDGFVLLTAQADGRAIVLPFLGPADAQTLPLTWDDTTPIATDFDQVLFDDRPSRFYEYIEEVRRP